MQIRTAARLRRDAAASALMGVSCSGDDGNDGKRGKPGRRRTVAAAEAAPSRTSGNGTKTITVKTARVSPSTTVNADGNGNDCTATENTDWQHHHRRGDASVTITPPPGPDASVTPGLGPKPDVAVAAPANGTHFVAGDKIVDTIDLKDGAWASAHPGRDEVRGEPAPERSADMSKNKTAAACSRPRPIGARPRTTTSISRPPRTRTGRRGSKLTDTLEPVTHRSPGTTRSASGASWPLPADQVFELEGRADSAPPRWKR